MSFSSNYVLNERVSYLEWEVNNLIPPPGGQTLASVLATGNSAGTNNILMNNQNITGATVVETGTLQLTDATNTVASTGSGGNLVLASSNGSITDIITNTSKFYQVQIPSGFPRFTVGATGVQINGIPLSFDSTNNLGIQPSGGYTTLTLASKNANGIVQIAVANGSSVVSTPVVVNSATTTISNATTINNLVSTTQPNGTNNTSVATTQFVQSAISAIPGGVTPLPYFWGETANLNNFSQAVQAFGLNLPSTGAWGQNAYLTLRVNLEQSYILGANNAFPYFQSWSFLMDIYPGRLTTMATAGAYQLNGTINSTGSTYAYTDATYAPNGRPYWARAYNNSSAPYTANVTAIPIYITTVSGASGNFLFNVLPPINIASTGAWRFSATVELINSGNYGSATISSTLGSIFAGGNQYASF